MAEPNSLVHDLEAFGASPRGVLSLGGPETPAHLPYLDLVATRERRLVPDAVVEMEGRPVLYAARGPKPDADIRELTRRLAQRAQADYLAIVEPGRLLLFELDLLGRSPRARTIDGTSSEAALAIPRLALAPPPPGTAGTGPHLHDRLLRLLTATIEALTIGGGLEPEDALSLVGRAVFMRFLMDRDIVGPSDVRQVCSSADELTSCLGTPKRVSETCRWLDDTFNGDLLPLKGRGGPSLWTALSEERRRSVCHELTTILFRTDPGGQLRFGWDTLHFDHVPVGVLSQVYEHYSHRFETSRAVKHSVYYTPRSIAQYMVDEALYALDDAPRASVLDPAAGAGVFLIAAFRALVREQWRRTERRPRRHAIRRILYNQLTGFDVNEAALRLAALGLYLTALELDPQPQPLTDLRFADLRGRVLVNVTGPGDKDDAFGLPALGSLGSHIMASHRDAYDVVVGNPPWTAWKRRAGSRRGRGRDDFAVRVEEVGRVVNSAARHVAGAGAPPLEMTDFTPDLAFFWRALEWVRPRGRVALAMHARLLFKQSAPGVRARAALFRTARVTGIVNGASVRNTKVWPGVSAPFCLVFCERARPRETDSFHLASPVLEGVLNDRGVVRIDSAAAVPILIGDAVGRPWLLKTLYRGTELDAEILDRLEAQDLPSLEQYWRMLELAHGQGFQVGGPAREDEQKPVGLLAGLPELTKHAQARTRINATVLPKLAHKTLLYPRSREIYRAPLVLVPESPPEGGAKGRVMFSNTDIAYNESFLGFSCSGHPQADRLARYLLVLLSSDLAIYVALVRSSKFGVERDAYLLADVEGFPIKPLASLSGANAKIQELSELVLAERAALSDIEAFVADVYGLSKWDRETIADTLAVASPFAHARHDAQRPPTPAEVTAFAIALQAHLAPFLGRRGRSIEVEVVRHEAYEPWCFLAVSAARPTRGLSASALDGPTRMAFIGSADAHGASLVICRAARAPQLTVGILAQYRYWTRTRARLLALELRRLHEDFLVEARVG